MKLLVVLSLAAVALASPQFGSGRRFPVPQPRSDHKHIAILSDNRYDNGDGNFGYDFETEHGIDVEAKGTPGSKGQSNIGGSYKFILPDGTQAVVTYIADENGYRAESPLNPTPHPLPAHAIEQIRFAEQQARSPSPRRPF
ncbi:cuticle protein AM1199-like [Eriocheir sinensis]|uniref:cuticle protein AM1199-like n=1 Tax=Eriocheir sinensis TaxID=95602 RepID=UPI0021C57B16|nr:cuticle protein AM1199-like [Eriocheir sinensis]